MSGGLGGTDIYRIKYDNGIWGEKENLGANINSEKDELFPFILNNTLYFSSNCDGGLGGLDIYYSSLKNESFAEKQNIGSQLNTNYDDFGFFANIENKEIKGFISSDRPESTSGDNVFKWIIPEIPFKIEGLVTSTENDILPNVNLQFFVDDNQVGTVTTDSEGKYSFSAKRNQTYTIKTKAIGYISEKFVVEAKADDKTEIFEYNMQLEKSPVFAVIPITEDSVIIENMRTRLFVNNEVVYSTYSGEKGISWAYPDNYRLNDSIPVSVSFAKDGFISRQVDFPKIVGDVGKVIIYELVETVNIVEILEIQPIYYDYDKSDIRPDAAIELDKVVAFLKDNPNIYIELSSHTDCRGQAKYNLDLSERRAVSAAQYVQERINNPKQIYGKGFGASKLLVKCSPCSRCSEKDHALNRRTEFKIVNIEELEEEEFIVMDTPKNIEDNNETIEESEDLSNETEIQEIIPIEKEIPTVYFAVQIRTSANEISLNSDFFKGRNDVRFYKHNNSYNYIIGMETDYNAITVLNKELKSDFPDCLIIALDNERRIPINEARRKISGDQQAKENVVEEPKVNEDIVFKIQVLTSPRKLDESHAVYNNQGKVDYYFEDGMYKYTVGEEHDIDKINQLREQLNSKYPGCFVVAFHNNVRIPLSRAKRMIKE